MAGIDIVKQNSERPDLLEVNYDNFETSSEEVAILFSVLLIAKDIKLKQNKLEAEYIK